MPVASTSDDVPDLQHPALLLDHHRVQERGAGQPRHQRRVLDRIPGPVAAPAELGVATSARRARSRCRGSSQAASVNGRVRADPLGVDAARDQRADRERERAPRTACSPSRASAGGSSCAGGAAAGSGRRPRPARGATRVERRLGEHQQRREERAEAQQHRGRVRRDSRSRWRVRNRTRLDHMRQQPQPQQQRALLRGPHRGQRGRTIGVVVDECARDDREARSPSAGTRPRGSRTRPPSSRAQRVDRAAAGRDPARAAPAARAVERRADRRRARRRAR